MSSKALRKVNIGIETNPGVGVAVDTALYALSSSKFGPKVDKVQPDEDLGNHGYKRDYIDASSGEGNLDIDAVYEQAHVPVALGMGKVAAAGIGPYTWTFPFPTTTDITPCTASTEFYGDANTIVRSEQVIAESFEISGTAGKTWQIKDKLAGACTYYAAGVTGSPVLPTDVHAIAMKHTKLYSDALYANIGDTEVSGTFDFSLKVNKMLVQKTHAGSEWPDEVGVGGKADITLALVIEADEAGARTIRDNLKVEDTTRAYRIEAISSAATREARIDLSGVVTEVAPLTDRQEDNTFEITIKGQVDTLGNLGEIEVINNTNVL